MDVVNVNVILFSVRFNHGRATYSTTDVNKRKMLAANSPIYSLRVIFVVDISFC